MSKNEQTKTLTLRSIPIASYRFFKREIDALKLDKTMREDHTTEEFFEYLDTYPSLYRRYRRLTGVFHRAVSNVRNFRHEVGYFIHRGRKGWAKDDTWSLDYTLAKRLDEMFEAYYEVSHKFAGPPMSFADAKNGTGLTDDEWRDIILKIRRGFRNYILYEENWHSLSYEEMDEAYETVMAQLKESFDLMHKHWGGFWW